MKQRAYVKHLADNGITLERYHEAQDFYKAYGWSLNYVTRYREFWLSRFHPDDSLLYVRCRMGVASVVRAIQNPDEQLMTCATMLSKVKP
jgi:hypothetical protein